MKMRIPRSVAMFITSLQILQFVLSVLILAHLGILIYIRKVCYFWFFMVSQIETRFRYKFTFYACCIYFQIERAIF